MVTVLFADLAGFASLAEHLDPEDVQHLLNRCFDRLVPCVERYGGTIDKFIGDALMALFGAPVAHEHDAERAVRAALDLRESLQEFNREQGLELAVHIGINTGRVLAGSIGGGGHQQYSVVGDAVNLASRLEEVSARNEILIGPRTYRAVSRLFAIQEGEAVRVRGRDEETRTYRVLGEKDTAQPQTPRPLRAPLIGREQELAALTAALERLRQGQGGVVYLVGETGLGKTRLVAEGRKSVPAQDLTWREGQAIILGRSPAYGPVKQILGADSGFLPGDDSSTRYEKLRRRLDQLFTDEHERHLTTLAALLSLPSEAEAHGRLDSLGPNVFNQRLQESVRGFLTRLAAERPVVVVVEDIHWLDSSSAALVGRVLPLAGTNPLLFLVVARPELEGSRLDPERVCSLAGIPCQKIRLHPLSAAESRTLVSELLGSRELAAGLHAAIDRWAEGNPFFIEESLRSLIDAEQIQPDGKGGWHFTTRLHLSLPDTLQGAIAARVDRLPERTRRTLRMASVVGRTFPQSLIGALTGFAAPLLDRQLRRLQYLELIESVRRRPEPEFTFTHALIQEAVYESMLLRERRRLHERVAEEIESRFAGSLAEQYDLLAYHYSRAENWDRAKDYLLQAGDRARVLGAVEAGGCYQQALEGLLRGYELGLEESDPAHGNAWFDEGVGAFYNAYRLATICPSLEVFHARAAETFGPADRRTLAAAEMVGAAYAEQRMYPEARAILESTLRTREVLGDGDDPSLARLLRVLAMVAVSQGAFEEGEALLTRGLALQMAADKRDYDMVTDLYLSLLYTYHCAGRLERLREVADEALAIAGLEAGSQYSIILANICDTKMRLGRLSEAEAHARRGIKSARSSYVEAACRGNLGEVLISQGRYADALRELEQATEMMDGLGRSTDLGGLLSPLAECQLQLGLPDLAEESARRAANLLDKEPGVDRADAVWAWRVLAGIELARGRLDEAEQALEKAASFLTCAQPAGDRYVEAELLFRRAQLRLKQGRTEEASGDLARATELLTELGGEKHGRIGVMKAEWEQL
ncbi:MAG: AAA family ATPase [Thermoleophilia bacterium]|nr:AAA family ATPase [Thermoleophilia bacterium]